MKRIKWLGILLAALFVSNAYSANWSSCDRWGTYNNNGYTLYNNIWGQGTGTQCMWVNSYNNWGVWAQHPNTGGIKSYPNVSFEQNIRVSRLNTCRSSFQIDVPSSGAYSADYDLWYDNYSYEVMLWMNYRGDVAPISYNYDAYGRPVPAYRNVNLGGHTWNVYRGSNNVNEVFSFVRTSNTRSGTVDIAAISKWIRSRGWFGDANLHQIQFGFEITSSPNGEDFRVGNYSLSCY